MPTTQALTLSEINNAALGRPLLVGHNALRPLGSGYWSSNGGASGILSEGVEPTVCVDRRGDPQTRPISTSVVTTYTLAFSVGSNSFVADAAAVIGTNLQALAQALGDSIVIDLDTADDAIFSTGLTQVATWTVTSAGPNRLGALFSSAYVGQQFWRLTFDRLSGADFPTGSGNVPQIGEVVIGKRRQIPFNPQRPIDLDKVTVDEDSIYLPGGAIYGVTSQRGRGVWDLRFKLRADLWGQSAKEVLLKWHADSDYGATSVWMPNTSNPNRVHLARPADRSLSQPEVSLALSEVSMNLEEVPPFYRPEVATIGV